MRNTQNMMGHRSQDQIIHRKGMSQLYQEIYSSIEASFYVVLWAN